MYCQNCGSQLPDSAKFCDRCGAKVGTDTERSNSNTEYNMASIMVNKKSEALALILSLLIPGLGQIYNGQVSKGAMMIVAAIVCAVLIFVFFPMGYCTSCSGSTRCTTRSRTPRSTTSTFSVTTATLPGKGAGLQTPYYSIRLTRTVHPGSTEGAMQSASALSLII